MMQTDNSTGDLSAPLVTTFIPSDFSDVGQGTLLANAYRHCLCYCDSMGWMTYKNGIWEPSKTAARSYSQKLTTLQLQEAAATRYANLRQGKSSEEAEHYLKYANSRRSTSRVTAAITEAEPLLSIETSALDCDPLILNTPSGEVDLRTGEMMPHNPAHYITRKTSVAPTDEGIETWQEFLLQISCGDESVGEFLQQFAGMAAIGKVYEERLVIAVGSGGNGKSTFFNALQDVLGDYAGTIRSELMISTNDSGKKFEYANLRGKRFIIAEELEQGKQLDTAAVKQLCSTGDINAQFKGKDVFTFKPSHSTVLCTNHMPSVKAIDNGTWDRLIVIPFKGRFRNQGNEIKNYGAYLVEHCGGAILSWIIEGAQKYIQNDYKLIVPEEIQSAIEDYKGDNDWAEDFFQECLVFEPELSATGNELYDEYTTYCQLHSLHKLAQNVVMPRIAEHPSVTKKRTNSCYRYYGVGVAKPDPLNLPESLKLLDALNEKRAVQCRVENQDLYDLDDIF